MGLLQNCQLYSRTRSCLTIRTDFQFHLRTWNNKFRESSSVASSSSSSSSSVTVLFIVVYFSVRGGWGTWDCPNPLVLVWRVEKARAPSFVRYDDSAATWESREPRAEDDGRKEVRGPRYSCGQRRQELRVDESNRYWIYICKFGYDCDERWKKEKWMRNWLWTEDLG